MSDQNVSEFDRTFGAAASKPSTGLRSNAAPSEKPKAQVWINVGYETNTTDAQGEPTTEFVALSQGIPLDTIEPEETNHTNAFFQKKARARNNLREQLLNVAATLKPGEEKIYGARGSLQIQIRRIKDAAAAVADDQNDLIQSLTL
ncbi:ssDNA-binding protein [Stenotrophomonas phage Piffle]|uniref:SsDNA-binding protein n=1 Tax=Stenotrophomonas phage Piffle TaxID=2859656 RepID=A0AAE7WLV3_9CAUD|nr:ssDNA-binding protein [Stenotrophomonas phage Piffle]QYW01867.1 ssDNA-binding protein [Stenotrophomonas phage Piffle]